MPQVRKSSSSAPVRILCLDLVLCHLPAQGLLPVTSTVGDVLSLLGNSSR
jgi:hypothetical protein